MKYFILLLSLFLSSAHAAETTIYGGSGTGLTADGVEESHLKAVDTAADEECLTYEATVGDFEWQSCSGTETNDLEGNSPSTIQTGEILIGQGAGDASFNTVSGDATLSSAGVLTIASRTESIDWNAAGITADGTECADAAKVTLNSGPVMYTVICTDSDSASMYGHTTMPDGYDGGTVTFELAYIQTAADTSALNEDVAAQCRGAGDTVNSTWGTEVAIDDAAVNVLAGAIRCNRNDDCCGHVKYYRRENGIHERHRGLMNV